MDAITLTEIVSAVTILAGVVSALTLLHKSFKKLLTAAFQSQTVELARHVDRLEMTSAKNFIITCFATIDRGHALSDMARQRFWEAVEEYHRQGGNGYIDSKIDVLKVEGKL